MDKFKLVTGLTTKCNGKCVLCARHLPTFNEGLDLNYELDIELLKPLLPHLETIMFVGGYGDTILHSRFLELIQFININYPSIELVVSSNMGMRTTEYWRELGKCKIRVICNIDGIGETNAIYRGINYKLALNNLKTFINNGGVAEWSALYFNYNSHQMKELEQIAKDVGCMRFRIRRGDEYIEGTEYIADIPPRKPLTKKMPTKEVYCEWKDNNQIYLNEFGYFTPCCHSDPNYGVVKEDSYLSTYYHTYKSKLYITQMLNNILKYIEIIYNNKNDIPLCNHLCRVPKHLKPYIVFIKTVMFEENK